MRRTLAGLIAAWLTVGPAQAADTLMTLTPRPGAVLQVVTDQPLAPVGSMILLAGGSGVLDIDAEGRIRQLTGNHLVRTRAAYVRAGYAVFVPDIASDLKSTDRYRLAAAHAEDLALVIAAARRVAEPVWLVATSRGAVSAINVVVRPSAAMPDGVVISSGTLMNYRLVGAVSAGDVSRIRVPVMLLRHRDDACFATSPDDADRFKALLSGAPKVDIVTLSGGSPAGSNADPCGAFHYHGFNGIDAQAVAAVVAWVQANTLRESGSR